MFGIFAIGVSALHELVRGEESWQGEEDIEAATAWEVKSRPVLNYGTEEQSMGVFQPREQEEAWEGPQHGRTYSFGAIMEVSRVAMGGGGVDRG